MESRCIKDLSWVNLRGQFQAEDTQIRKLFPFMTANCIHKQLQDECSLHGLFQAEHSCRAIPVPEEGGASW